MTKPQIGVLIFDGIVVVGFVGYWLKRYLSRYRPEALGDPDEMEDAELRDARGFEWPSQTGGSQTWRNQPGGYGKE